MALRSRRTRARYACAALAAVLATGLAGSPAAQAAGRCGQHAWCDTSLSPDRRAGLLLRELTRDEKISLLAGDELTGVAGGEQQHTGTSHGVERVGLPPVYFSDGPVGPRQGQATAMPAPMSLAASFDPSVAFRHAMVVGDEVRKKGNDVVFAPAVNMMRTPLNGRTFEYFGEDPFLAARMTVGWTKGVQAQGVIGNVKHYAVNNQEGMTPVQFVVAPGAGSRFTVDARVDERALREIYLAQFEAAVKEGQVGSVMCAYPRVNGAYACENEHLLEDILKGDWDFDGFVLTDYGAAKDTVNSLNNGLDLDIWPALVYRPQLVNAALASGAVREATVDEHVRRILRTLFRFGFFDRDAYPNDSSRIDRAAHHADAAEIEQAGIVLLENDGGLLPLDAARIGRLAVIGPEAQTLRNGGGSSAINAFMATTPLEGIEARVGREKVVFDDGSSAERAAEVARSADAAVVVVGDKMSEGYDKPCLGLNCGQSDDVDRDALIERVAAAQPRTVVVLQSGGPVLTPWRDEVPGLLEAWYPGQNGGTAIARVLFGDAEPGGRLPATFPVREADQPTSGDPEAYPGVGERVVYKEGVLIGYRWFDFKQLDVAYPFGYGLSYTTFRLGGLRVRPAAEGRLGASVSLRVTNTGKRAGSEVAQIYVGMPADDPALVMPPRQLKGFEKVTLAPGESRRVRVDLDERAFASWDTAADGWRVAPGCYRIMAGRSSRDIVQQAVVAVRGAHCARAVARIPGTAATRACVPRRAATLRLGVRRSHVRRVTVYVDGRRQRTLRGRRARIRVRLRGAQRRVARVKLVVRKSDGRTVVRVRRVKTCVRRAG